MKTLVCGIIGAAVAVAAWLALEIVTVKEFGWMAVLVGLVTGVVMHMAAGAHAGESYGRGALAALLALAACVGGPRLKVEYMQSLTAEEVGEVKVDPVADNGESAAAGAADGSGARQDGAARH